MYLPVALEVYNRLFIDSSGFMAVDEIKKRLLGHSVKTVTLGEN